MATNIAIVDEKDPLVHYAPEWDHVGSKGGFDETTSVGTSITTYSTVPGGSVPRTLAFSVDNSIPGSYNTLQLANYIHHVPLWSSPTMRNGTHTLVIIQETNDGVNVYMDYFMYNTTSTSVGAYFIDDSVSPRPPLLRFWSSSWRRRIPHPLSRRGGCLVGPRDCTPHIDYAEVFPRLLNIESARRGNGRYFNVSGVNLNNSIKGAAEHWQLSVRGRGGLLK
ncbi:hypothetical protein B0H19DRAFT_1236017 [Mycena capillaripes]|nr:hypothetical protein B0H19DRAFT_1236017 [Mycena capillaripes]